MSDIMAIARGFVLMNTSRAKSQLTNYRIYQVWVYLNVLTVSDKTTRLRTLIELV